MTSQGTDAHVDILLQKIGIYIMVHQGIIYIIYIYMCQKKETVKMITVDSAEHVHILNGCKD